MDRQGESSQGSLRLLRQAGLSRTESTRRGRSRTHGEITGLLSRQGHHAEEIAGRRAVHQPVRGIAARHSGTRTKSAGPKSIITESEGFSPIRPGLWIPGFLASLGPGMTNTSLSIPVRALP